MSGFLTSYGRSILQKSDSFFTAFFIFAFFLVAVMCNPAMAAKKTQPVETVQTGNGLVTELWDGKVLTATFRAGMCFEPTGITKGVLILRHSNGKEDVYHLYGTTFNNEFTLSHGSGHEFNGEFADDNTMKGKVKLANGLRISLKGERHKNVPLAAEDCAPLPR